MDNPKLKPATLAAQAMGALDHQSGGVVPPIQPATTFARDRDYQPLNPDNVYLRDQNEGTRLAEKLIARLEGAEASLLFPSGMAAIAAAFRTIPNGGRAIVQSGIYWGTTKWVREFCERRQITLDEFDARTPETLAQACVTPAQLVLIETPSNPWLLTVDIASAAEQAHGAGAKLLVDATAATPILCRPVEHGADLVMHSVTKAMNGHSDVLGGVLSTARDDDLWQEIATDRQGAGAVMSPFDAWLLVRGMRTLPLRVERMCENAQKIAEALLSHDRVEDVYYPGLSGFTGHDIASRQMAGGYGFLMSVLVKGGASEALAVAGRLNLFHRATSLGGVESLVEHRHTIEPHTGIPENLLRLSIGIEDADDLIADLDQALRS
ncbi:Cystathionine gamma-synthase [Falsiruegeria litorea R37]|uniref:Cystathionine gamma-synthase n=1 Tax=Falsiruegeria litorea R37 TaxID=1200284 RepID=A0A1Y5TEZ8_9RHOB|nr:PLP-dependent transferase [Falsiruegeria litorea]SLN62429.1 Cystathionine gamma-synthase [Falsiruegeria litorea R37]